MICDFVTLDVICSRFMVVASSVAYVLSVFCCCRMIIVMESKKESILMMYYNPQSRCLDSFYAPRVLYALRALYQRSLLGQRKPPFSKEVADEV